MEQFEADRQDVLARAQAAGVDTILAIGSGTGPGTLDCAIQIAEQHNWIYASIGIHPHEARLATEGDFAELQRLSSHPRVLAWGEIGLDYYYEHSPREIQREVFVRQIQMACSSRLPIIIHCRPSENSENAWDDCLALLSERWAPAGLPGIFHCFTGEDHHAERALDMGFLISFSGNVTFVKAENIRRVAMRIPLEKMLIETDSPFLAPVPHRGKRNEPAFVTQVAEKIAELRGLTVEEVARQTSLNFRRLFNLAA